MKIKLLYLLIVTLLLSNLFMIFMLVKKPHRPNHHKPNEFLLHKLRFTEDQKSSFDKLNDKHHKSVRRIEHDIRSSKELLFTSFGKKTSSYIDSITNQLGNLETKKHKEIVSFFGSVKNICDEEQAKKFNTLIKKGLNRRPRR